MPGILVLFDVDSLYIQFSAPKYAIARLSRFSDVCQINSLIIMHLGGRPPCCVTI